MKPQKDLFVVDNAKNLSPSELAQTFIPTKVFWDLLSPRNHIVLGSRGSGKTVLLKMLSYNHLVLMPYAKAQKLVRSRELIGIYVPTSALWVGSLSSSGVSGLEEPVFRWRVNVAACRALMDPLSSCLKVSFDDPGQRATVERALAAELSQAWSEEKFTFYSLRDLQLWLSKVEFLHSVAEDKGKMAESGLAKESSYCFASDMFKPVTYGMTMAAGFLELPESATWIICVDEAEFLSEQHHMMLNTQLRTHPEHVNFKISTTPYDHHTQRTTLQGDHVSDVAPGHDYIYVYIDGDPIVSSSGEGEAYIDTLAGSIFRKRAQASRGRYTRLTLASILQEPEQPLLARRPSTWEPGSEDWERFRRYADPRTIERAERLARDDPAALRDQIIRKIQGPLLLREAVDQRVGRQNTAVYSGIQMVIRCTDGNPRRMVQLFHRLLSEAPRGGQRGVRVLSPEDQNRILKQFSSVVFDRSRSVHSRGPELHDLLGEAAGYMRQLLHGGPISTDQVSSVRVTQTTDQAFRELIKLAVAWGYLYPNISTPTPTQLPEEGVFRLAYVLAPAFDLFPRKGQARSLSTFIGRDTRVPVLPDRTDQLALPIGPVDSEETGVS